jgi:hypothetical protein
MSRLLATRIRSLALAVLISTHCVRAMAADNEAAALADMQKKLDQSLTLIQALEARVAQLEAQRAPVAPVAPVAASSAPSPAAAASASPATDARMASVEKRLEQVEVGNATREGDPSSLPIHGFADVDVGSRNPYNPQLKAASVGNLDFYLTPKLGERTLSLFELNFEVDTLGNVDVDMERAQIGYLFSDAATVWVGRFHTPFGYVNTALHHGAWISDALRRPKFLQFEDHGGILPVHTVGAWLTGSEHAGDGKLEYDLYAGNGQEIIGGVLDMRNAGNAYGNPIVGGRLGYRFGGALEGLSLGVHGFVDKVTDDQLPQHMTRVRMAGGYLVYDTDQWENIAEFYAFNDLDLSGGTGTHRSEAGFVQLAYRFGWGIPYYRYERASLQQGDEFFAQQTNVNSGASYFRNAVGVRLDLDPKASVKVELANTHTTDRERDAYNEALIQYAIRF